MVGRIVYRTSKIGGKNKINEKRLLIKKKKKMVNEGERCEKHLSNIEVQKIFRVHGVLFPLLGPAT